MDNQSEVRKVDAGRSGEMPDGAKSRIAGSDPMLRFLIADDHVFMRLGTKSVLTENFDGAEVVEASCYDDIYRLFIHDDDFDLILLDLKMPRDDSLEDLKKFLRRIDGQTPVVAYSAIENPFEMAHVLRLGCRGFIPKSAAPSAFVHAIDLVLKGETYIPSKAVECFTVWDFGHRESGVQKRMDSLTRRQRDVLQLLSGGRSNKEIGRELNMLEGTVKVHVKAILRSLKVQNRTQAAVLGAGHYPGRGNI